MYLLKIGIAVLTLYSYLMLKGLDTRFAVRFVGFIKFEGMLVVSNWSLLFYYIK